MRRNRKPQVSQQLTYNKNKMLTGQQSGTFIDFTDDKLSWHAMNQAEHIAETQTIYSLTPRCSIS